MDADILAVAEEWAKAKYLSKDDSERKEKMEAVAVKADALVTKYPGRVEALIWDGIVTSGQAPLASVFSALSYANKARDLLNQAYKMDAKALDAGAPTSLGVLYYRVPGFPIAWGDKDKARHEQGEYAKAEQVLKTALALPPSSRASSLGFVLP
jgi:tetratricopeptide (TPR) repeat protein